MNASAIATALLIAMLRTSGEGAAVQIEYPDMAQCEAGGATLDAQFEALALPPHSDGTPRDGHPTVLWTCFEAPSQR